MKLSVIIVNYNVKHFLKQCLLSVKRALENIGNNGEVWVVDNHSVDGSVQMLKEEFKWVKLIENKENLGFSRANNLAIRKCSGEYVLLLNPDTIIPEDTFQKVIAFMDSNPQAGALGVRMIDGKGKFLPESKRGLPTPRVAFFKMIGLSKLFPKSKFFNSYHLGFLDEYSINEVDVLSGAFFLIRKSVLEKVGLLDEDYFMYGEDIDLSYRIKQIGYKNYYFPETTIIHYKGESTKKGTLNYVKMFYSAMLVFASKHLEESKGKFFNSIIKLSIYFRAFLSVLKNFSTKLFIPLIDFIIIYSIFYFISQFWQSFKYHDTEYYPREFYLYILPLYSFIIIISFYYTGCYSKNFRNTDFYKGISLGILILLLLYALMSEDVRFSRAVVLLGSIVIITFFLPFRLCFINRYILKKKKRLKSCLFLGTSDDYKRTNEIIKKTGEYENVIFFEINSEKNSEYKEQDIDEIIRINKIDELIFCSNSLTPKKVILLMTKFSVYNINYKIIGDALIGSKSVITDKGTYDIVINSIAHPFNKHNKRILDLILSFFLFILYPFIMWNFRNKINLLKNIILCMVGKYTFVGYAPHPQNYELPQIKPSVLKVTYDNDKARDFNIIYAREYKIQNDFIVIVKNFDKLDEKVSI